ncbi:MAG TPA: ATP-binding protein [Pseudolabrys sp.]|nr:ATP-binding protein [Pseudolabrys sp.]
MAATDERAERASLGERLHAAWRALRGRSREPTPASADPPGALDAAQTRLIQALIKESPAPAIVLDRDGRVIASNEGATAIAPALRQGESALASLRMPELVNAIRQAMQRDEPQRAEFVERVPRDRWLEAFVRPVRLGTSEKPELLLVAFNDLTPLRRVEEMRVDFVANASHELRTPLAALLGFIETLQGSAKDDPAARDKFLAVMQAQAARMARLIDDLLSLSRIELNTHIRPSTQLDLAPIVRHVVDGLQTLARDRGVEVNVTLPDEPLAVLGDRDELIRALENLVENALKYGASGGRVDVTLARGEGAGGASEAQLTVRDYGPGIAPDHLPRLTERFYRVDVTESRAQGGTGLGLALVKHILSRHGGRLSIESTFGQGASFGMHLPLARADKKIDESAG